MTWRRRSASRASSRVERKEAIRWWGSFRMKPTVSVSRAWWPDPRSTVRVAESRVANRRSSTKRSAPERAFRREDFPAFVYPTRAARNSPALAFRCTARAFATSLSFAFRSEIRVPISRRSVSSWVSPGPPRSPIPPRIRERWLHIRLQAGEEVLELSQLHLKLRFPASGPGGKDVENQLRAIQDPDPEEILQVLSLGRGELLVEDHQVDLRTLPRFFSSWAFPSPMK